MLRSARFLERDPQRRVAPTQEDQHFLGPLEPLREVLGAFDLLAVDLHDEVSAPDTRFRGSAFGLDLGDDHALGLIEAELVGDMLK